MTTKSVILLEDRPDISLLYGLNLHLYTGARVVAQGAVGDCMHYLQQNADQVSLVVSRVGKDNFALEVGQFLKKLNVSIPVVAIPEETPSVNGENKPLGRQKQLNNVIKASAQALGITADQMAIERVPDFYPIPLQSFRENLLVPCHTFKKAGENSYEQFHRKGDHILASEVQSLREEGVDYLYVAKENRLQFVDGVSQQIIALLENKDLENEEAIRYTASAQSLVHNQATALGIEAASLALADAGIGKMKEIAKGIPALEVLVKMLLANDLSYRYRHSHLIAYISAHLVRELEMKNPEEQIDKLSMAAFFQDLALTTDEMAKVKTDEEIVSSEFDEKDQQTILKHALIASSLLSKHDSIPDDVVTIVKQHHGHRQGTSLSEKQNQISPLAAIFTVAEHWSHLVLEYEGRPIKLSQTKVIKHFAQLYSLPVFKKVMAVLDGLKI